MISVIGTLRRTGPVEGVWRAKLKQDLRSVGGHLIYPRGAYAQGAMVAQAGEVSFDIEAPDGVGLLPTHAVMVLELNLNDGTRLVYEVPLDQGNIDVATLIDVDEILDAERFILVGVAGGVAALDEEGRVVDANGDSWYSIVQNLIDRIETLEQDKAVLPPSNNTFPGNNLFPRSAA